MSEHEPFEKVRASGKEHEMTSENSSVWTHLGKLAIFDHVYVKTEENGVYLWRYAPMDGKESSFYHHIQQKALDNNCKALLNMDEVEDKDRETYIRHALKDLNDLPPEFEEE